MLADAVHQVERVEQGRGDGDGAVDPAFPLLQALENQGASGEVDAIGGEGEGLGEAAAGIGEGHAQGAGVAVGALGGTEEGVALAGAEVFARPIRDVQLHPGAGARASLQHYDAISRSSLTLIVARQPGRCCVQHRSHECLGGHEGRSLVPRPRCG